jgi:phospholipid/cholesterol/gamma-HCH transport system ATP-binding protein
VVPGKLFFKKFIECLYAFFRRNFFDGRDINTMTRDEKQHLRSEIGTVFQGSALFDSLTVEENIMFPWICLPIYL